MLTSIQITVAIALIIFILLQERGGGLSGIFGGQGSEFYQTRRGLERSLFFLTILFIAIFIGLSILNLVIKS